MDQELRELHAQMRKTEMSMKSRGAVVGAGEPPNYADLQIDGSPFTMQRTTELRMSGAVR